MTEEMPEPPGGLMTRGTPQSVALGVDAAETAHGVLMRIPFRADLVGDPELGGLADGAIYTLLDQACGQAISVGIMAQFGTPASGLGMGAMATLDFRIDYVRPARRGAAVMAQAACQRIDGEVAFVRGAAFETDPEDPIALVQAAFMLSTPTVGA